MRTHLILGVVVALLVAAIGAGAATAGQTRLNICHTTGDGTFQLIEVAEPAYLNGHMDHGDGVTGGVVPGMEGYVFDDACVPVALLAVAYTNVDGEDGYNPDVDVLIARFEDIDDDGVPSVGDIIRTNRYPIDFNDLTGAGTFGVTQHTITDDFHVIYSTVSLDLILTETDTGTDQVFRWTTNTEGTTELYQEVSCGAEFTLFRDAINVSVDLCRVNPVSPSQPDAAAGMENLHRPSDDPFIDVDITPPPA